MSLVGNRQILTTLVLLGIGGSAAAALYVEDRTPKPWANVDQAAISGSPGSPARQGAAVQSIQFPPISAFAEIVERPLFTASRRPFEAPIAMDDAPKAPAAVNVLLSGVIITGSSKVAHLRVPDDNRVREVSEGGSLNGWRVDAILPDRVVMSLDGETREIMLKRTVSARPVKAGRSGATADRRALKVGRSARHNQQAPRELNDQEPASD